MQEFNVFNDWRTQAASAGEFRAKDGNRHFEYAKGVSKENYQFPQEWRSSFPDVVEVHCGTPAGGMYKNRAAKVMKTVVYVVTDETDCGQPIAEKWEIKNHRVWKK